MLILSFICLKGFNLCTPGLYRRYIAISLSLYKSFRSSFSFLIFSSSSLLRQRRGTGDFVIGKLKEISSFFGYDISSTYIRVFWAFKRTKKTEPRQGLAGSSSLFIGRCSNYAAFLSAGLMLARNG